MDQSSSLIARFGFEFVRFAVRAVSHKIKLETFFIGIAAARLPTNPSKQSTFTMRFIRKHKTLDEMILPASNTAIKKGVTSDDTASLSSEESCQDQVHRVRFDTRSHDCSLSAANQKFGGDCWYSVEDYRRFKVDAVKTAKKLTMTALSEDIKFYQTVLTHIYDTCCQEHQELISEDGDYDSVLSFSDHMDLKKCMSNPQAMGLDRLALRTVALEIQDRKRLLIHHVKATATTPAGTVDAEALRKALEPVSLPSRLFAMEKARAISDFCFC